MERVQFQQEQMLAELKDLVLKGLFSEVEIKQIIKKRTEFETALVRRIAKKSDYLRYAAYEMDLETLRRKRAARLTEASSQSSVSDFALVRRQFHILERAVRKFKSDVGMWTQYIEVANKMGARALAGKVTARALQLHPNVASLYILAASQELHSLSTSAARTLLQRGIRLNPDSIQLWAEYAKMELGFIEGLRRRWSVLGLDMNSDRSGHRTEGTGTESLTADDLDDNSDDESINDATRMEIMNGAIVQTVMSNAVRAIPKIEMFNTLKELISNYPVPPALRESLLDHLYALLQEQLPDNDEAVTLLSSRFVRPGEVGTALVEGLKKANEEFVKAIGRNDAREGICCGYTEFVETWCKRDIDSNLKLYLLSSLKRVADEWNQVPWLLSGYIRVASLVSFLEPALIAPEKLLRAIRKVVCKGKNTAGDVWIARLEAESRLGSRGEAEKAWNDARSSVKGERTEEVWMWIFGNQRAKEDLLEELLKDSRRDSSLRTLHNALLMRYMTETGDRTSDEAKIKRIRDAAQTYAITPGVWDAVFTQEGSQRVLKEIFEQWRLEDGGEATVRWAAWLHRNGKDAEAAEEIARARKRLCEEERRRVDERWAQVLDGDAWAFLSGSASGGAGQEPASN